MLSNESRVSKKLNKCKNFKQTMIKTEIKSCALNMLMLSSKNLPENFIQNESNII